jgi:hypothetical protein
MEFEYDSETRRMVSTEDPSIALAYHGYAREGGVQFVFHWGEKRIGLETALDSDGRRVYLDRLADGTFVWLIGSFGRSVHANDEPWPLLTNFEKFENEAEQEKALSVLADAFKKFDGNHKNMSNRSSKGKLEFTQEVASKILQGEFVK